MDGEEVLAALFDNNANFGRLLFSYPAVRSKGHTLFAPGSIFGSRSATMQMPMETRPGALHSVITYWEKR